MDSHMNSIDVSDRLDRLEKKVKSQRRIITVMFSLSILFFCIFVAKFMGLDLFRPKVIRAESFVLQDESGVIRSQLSTRNDMTLFAMYDRNGIPRNAVFAEPESNGFHVYDGNGIRRSVLGYRNNETSLVFMNQGGFYQSGLIAKSDGVSAFQLGDHEQIPLHNLSVSKVN